MTADESQELSRCLRLQLRPKYIQIEDYDEAFWEQFLMIIVFKWNENSVVSKL